MGLRILFTGLISDTLPPPYAGIPKRTLLLAKSWKEQGHEVAVTFTHRQPQEDDLGADGQYFFEFKNKPTKVTKFFWIISKMISHPFLYLTFLRSSCAMYGRISHDPIVFSAYGVFLDEVVKTFKPDVLLCESALIRTMMACFVAERYGIPVVLDTYAEVHFTALQTTDRLGAGKDAYWKKFFSFVKMVIAPSEYCAQGPRQYLPEDKVKVIFSGIEVAKYAKAIGLDRDEVRDALNLPQDAFIALAVGAYTSRKGHDHLIQAAASLVRMGENIHVALCGAGEPDWLRRLAEEQGISERVHIFQKLSELDLMKLYRSVDVYVDASNTPRACLGMSLTEAMAVSLPTIAYRIGGLPEVVHDGVNGLLVQTDDIPALAAAILRIQRMSVEERASLGKEGLRMAQELVDIHRTSQRLLSVLTSAISK